MHITFRQYPDVDYAKTCAFVVGGNEYDHYPNLKNGEFDAKAVRDEFERVGVNRITFALNRTFEELIVKTNEYLSQLRKGDVAFIYFAVHGVQFQNKQRVLAKDSNPKNLADTSLDTLLLLLGSGTCLWCLYYPRQFLCINTANVYI